MKMNWYYRMIVSYAPILFVIISSMILLFFLVLNNASERKYIETNQAILDRMVFNADANLMLVERNAVSKLFTDGDIGRFFSDRERTAIDDFALQKRLVELSSSLPFANTVYLYNKAEERMISDVGSYVPETFADYEFLTAHYSSDQPGGWHDPRPFAYSALDPYRREVVSLVKPYSAGGELRGALVVNVYLQSLIDYLNTLNESASRTVRMAQDGDEGFGSAAASVQSEYTGWRFVAEGGLDKGYNLLSLFSNAWMLLLVIVILLALVGFTVVTHLHYKPIQSIMEKVGQFANRKSGELGMKGANNEFTFIEKALDHLLQRSLEYESLYKEDNLLRQQRLFHELLAGHLRLSDAEFMRKLTELNLPARFDRLGVLVAEIDYYPKFIEQFKVKDQHLLKFIIESAFRDLGQQHRCFVWHAWLEPNRIAFVVHHVRSDPRSDRPVIELAEQFRKWINQHLELTVSIGIGRDADSIASVADACRSARNLVMLKTIFGTNAIIDHRMSAGMSSLNSYAYLQALEGVAQSFRKHERDWREKLAQIFAELRKTRFVKEDMAAFMNGYLMQMDKAVGTLSEEVQELWRSEYRAALLGIHEQAETLDELEEQLIRSASAYGQRVEEARSSRKYHSLALQAKRYIDAHFADADLSLSLVSEMLKLQPSTLSLLFKEELGEKFIDYVLKIRMEHAKRLLVETDDPIQSIAERTGYRNVISFYRAFKKFQDIPPGEYRHVFRTS